jgi:hypothetical protein
MKDVFEALKELFTKDIWTKKFHIDFWKTAKNKPIIFIFWILCGIIGWFVGRYLL